MNKEEVIKELVKKYPDKLIICFPETEPSEILCEIEPTIDHPEYSRAIAVIDESKRHVHQKTTETYKVLSGELEVYSNDIKHSLKQGDVLTILPGQVHWAKGNATWIECYSQPGWTIDDHMLV